MKQAILILALTAIANAQTADAVLNRMDQAAKTFKSLSADVHRVDYAAVFDETNAEDGTFKMKRAKTGVILLAQFTGRDERTIFIQKNKVEMYHPKANSEDIYDTRNFTKSADSLILVGFGTSRAELESRFSVKPGPSETIGGKKTTRIDLTPKSKEEKNFFNMIQLWIPDGEGNPVQEKILSGKENKDYNLLSFSNMKINPSIPESDFELKLPPGVKKIVAGK